MTLNPFSWLLMRYPLPKSTRAKLVRLYYELCIVPGIEARVIRNWADMLSRLLANKPGMNRKLDARDLELPWQPLWRVLQKELWPKKRVQDNTYVAGLLNLECCSLFASRNVINLLLYVAEQCKHYFPASEIPRMLETFIPMVTKEVSCLDSYLLPAHPHNLDDFDHGTSNDMLLAPDAYTSIYFSCV